MPFLRTIRHRLNQLRLHRHWSLISEALSFDDSGAESYEDADIVSSVSLLTQQLRARLEKGERWISPFATETLLVFSALPQRARILDFGGACGEMFFMVDHFRPGAIDAWHVVETPAMVAEAQRFANSRLAFTVSLEEAAEQGPFDMVIASGVLQYVPAPFELLAQLTQLNARYLYLARTEVSMSGQAIVTRQHAFLAHHGPQPPSPDIPDRIVQHTITWLPRESLLSAISKSHEISFHFAEDEPRRVRSMSGPVEVQSIGLFATKRN